MEVEHCVVEELLVCELWCGDGRFYVCIDDVDEGGAVRCGGVSGSSTVV